MAGEMALPPRDFSLIDYRELIIRYDAFIFARWDHTAMIAAMLDGVSCMINNTQSKKKIRPKGFLAFHPLRKKSHGRKGAIRFDASNLKSLKGIFSKLKGINKA